MLSSEDIGQVRDRLGVVGAWLAALRPAPVDEERDAARRIEAWGYGSLWSGEGIGGQETFAHMAVLLAATDHLVLGTGIANVWLRHPVAMQGGAATLAEAYPGRFILGVGISHAALVGHTGQVYDRPLARMKDYLDGMDAAVAGAPRPHVAAPRLLAALRPRMLELARERADGSHPYFVPPEHSALAREVVGPDKLLIPEQAVLLSTDPAEARRVGREHTKGYLQLPNYVNNLRHLGFGDEDLAGQGSDRLVDAVVAWGDEEAIARRVQAHRDAGADHVLLQPLGDLPAALRQLEVLAPAVVGG